MKKKNNVYSWDGSFKWSNVKKFSKGKQYWYNFCVGVLAIRIQKNTVYAKVVELNYSHPTAFHLGEEITFSRDDLTEKITLNKTEKETYEKERQLREHERLEELRLATAHHKDEKIVSPIMKEKYINKIAKWLGIRK